MINIFKEEELAMLYFFTDPYPDEFLYNTFCRFHRYSNNSSPNYTFEDLFGVKTTGASLHFPNRLEHFCQQFYGKTKYTPGYFIENHTIFPIFSPFLTQTRKKEFTDTMRQTGSAKSVLSTIICNLLHKDRVKVCPDCIKESRMKFGEGYLKRNHQIPGYYICIEHNRVLTEYEVTLNDLKNCFIDINRCNLEEESNDQLLKYKIDLFNISKELDYFINTDLSSYNPEIIRKKYLSIVKELDFYIVGKGVNQKKIHEKFISYYSSEFLRLFNSDVEFKYNSWLKGIFEDRDKTFHPIRHLLLIKFLFGNVKNFLNYKEKGAYYFGQGPFPCLNPVARHFKEPVIDNYEVRNSGKKGKLLGIFTCECGFVYSRLGPDVEKANIYNIRRIWQYGDLWESKLKELYNASSYSLAELARFMKCDVVTIKLFLRKFKNNEKVNLISSTKTNSNDNLYKLKVYQDKLKNLLNKHLGISRSQLQSMAPVEYAWLKRNYRDVLEGFLPKANRARKDIKGSLHVDWEKRDEMLNDKITEIITDILSNKKLVRISMGYVRRMVKYGSLHDNLDKLPKTRTTLESFLETVEDYQIRRINYVVCELNKANIPLKKTVILTKAKLYECTSKKVKDYLDSFFNRDIIKDKM